MFCFGRADFAQDVWRNTKTERRNLMSNDNNNRLLMRMGARQLTQNEIEKVAGSRLSTLASVLFTGPVYNPDQTLDT
jgi:hypothetical protein